MDTQSLLFDRSGSGQLFVSGPDAAVPAQPLHERTPRIDSGPRLLAYFLQPMAKVMGQPASTGVESAAAFRTTSDAPAGSGEACSNT